jgi:uncharacterized membrane protein YfcA
MDGTVFLAIGAAAGVCSGLFGIGGGVIIVPALIFAAKMPTHTATGTSLAALLLPVGLAGAWEYWRRGHVQPAAALWIAVGLLLGAWAGARLAQKMSGPQLRLAFGIFMSILGIYMAATAIRRI